MLRRGPLQSSSSQDYPTLRHVRLTHTHAAASCLSLTTRLNYTACAYGVRRRVAYMNLSRLSRCPLNKRINRFDSPRITTDTSSHIVNALVSSNLLHIPLSCTVCRGSKSMNVTGVARGRLRFCYYDREGKKATTFPHGRQWCWG